MQVGGAGLSAAVLAEVDRALDDHELIKVRLRGADREDRTRMAGELCRALGAEDVQGIGHVRVLYRERPRDETQASPRGQRRSRQR